MADIDNMIKQPQIKEQFKELFLDLISTQDEGVTDTQVPLMPTNTSNSEKPNSLVSDKNGDVASNQIESSTASAPQASIIYKPNLRDLD